MKVGWKLWGVFGIAEPIGVALRIVFSYSSYGEAGSATKHIALIGLWSALIPAESD